MLSEASRLRKKQPPLWLITKHFAGLANTASTVVMA